MPSEIYLDNNATTHLSGTVRDAMKAAVERDFGNPSSEHRSGENARRAIFQSRNAVAALLGLSADRLLFGSGATELNYWVLCEVLRKRGNAHLVTTQVEHSSVLETASALEASGVRVTRLSVDRGGRIDLAELLQAVDNETSLVSIQWVNNETGVTQPVREIAEICTGFGVPFHCDASQAIGKVEVDFDRSGIDYLTTSAHKMHGPAGVGGLCVKDRFSLRPLLRGGSQEFSLRPGTENLLGIVGFGAAANERASLLDDGVAFVGKLRDRFEALAMKAIPNIEVNGSTEFRVCNSTNLTFPGLDGAAIVALLDCEGVRCSQSSACTSSRPEPSYVLRAMGRNEDEAFASVRFSFSDQNTMTEVETAASKLVSVVGRLSGFAQRQTSTDNLQGAAKHEV